MNYTNLNDQFAAIAGESLAKEGSKRVSQYERLFAQLNAKIKSLSEAADHPQDHTDKIRKYRAIQELLATLAATGACDQPEVCYPGYFAKIELLLKKLPEKVILRQGKRNYFGQTSDNLRTRLVKKLKLFLFLLQYRVNQFINVFRRRKKLLRFWFHQVPMKQVANRHFKASWIEKLEKINEIETTVLCAALLSFKAAFDQQQPAPGDVATDDLNTDLSSIREQVDSYLAAAIADQQTAFALACEKVGTIELGSGPYAHEAVNKEYSDNVASWQAHKESWHNNLHALLDKWRSELELLLLENQIKLRLSQFESSQTIELLDELQPDLEASKALIGKIRQQVTDHEDALSSLLKKVKYQTQKEFLQGIIPRLSSNIINQNICNQINRLEAGIVKDVGELNGQFLIDKKADYNTPTKKKDLSSVSNKELVSFEKLPDYRNKLEEIRKELFLLLQNISDEVHSLGQVLQYSVSSAISAIEDDQSADPKQISQFLQGLDRSEVLLNKIIADISNTVERGIANVNIHTLELADELAQFNNIENVLKLRIGMAKAQAEKKAQQYRQQVLLNIGKSRNKLKERYLAFKSGIEEKLQWVNEKILLTNNDQTISRELTDFLRESQEVTGKLPAIYKRLYKIEPLEEDELFVGRTQELDQLKEACVAWKSGRHAATVIVGEKYGGVTSFLNYALPKLPVSCPVIRYEQEQNIASVEDLLAVFQHIFPEKQLTTLEALSQELNEGYERIIVIEDLHNLFVRKIEGFNALKRLYELINETLGKVFWITSTTSHTWEYLNRTTNVSEFFSYRIRLQEFSKSQITELVNRRNRISGYQIRFANEADTKTQKKLTKLEEIDQQVVLQDLFFQELNGFAKGNISLALRYWLLSTISVTESTIAVGSFQKPDFSFVKLMSMEKVFILHALILHDGLTASQLSEVINTSVGKCKLNLIAMLEDGVINQVQDAFFLNPLLYRNVIGLLKSKNLLQG